MKRIKVFIYIIVSLVILAIILYGGWIIKNRIDWNKRLSQSNVSELYGKQTSGVANDRLIEIARQYIKSTDIVYLNNNKINRNENELLQTGFPSDWFSAHAPESIGYNSTNNSYTVYWLFMPGCEKRPEDKVSKPNWFNINGSQCLGGYGVSVFIDNSLVPQKLDIKALN